MALKKKTLGLRRNLKEEERRTQIQEAAIEAFSSRGYDQTTLDDIAMEAGISKSLLYWYWEGKAALLSELIDICLVQYKDLLLQVVNSTEPYPQKVSRFLKDYLGLAQKNEKLNKLVHFCSLHSSNKTGENFGEKVNGYYTEIIDLLACLIHQGIDAGSLREDLDPKDSALILLSLIEGHIYLSILGDRPTVDSLLGRLYQWFLE